MIVKNTSKSRAREVRLELGNWFYSVSLHFHCRTFTVNDARGACWAFEHLLNTRPSCERLQLSFRNERIPSTLFSSKSVCGDKMSRPMLRHRPRRAWKKLKSLRLNDVVQSHMWDSTESFPSGVVVEGVTRIIQLWLPGAETTLSQASNIGGSEVTFRLKETKRLFYENWSFWIPNTTWSKKNHWKVENKFLIGVCCLGIFRFWRSNVHAKR